MSIISSLMLSLDLFGDLNFYEMMSINFLNLTQVLQFILNLYALIFKIKLFQKFGVHNTSDTISVIF